MFFFRIQYEHERVLQTVHSADFLREAPLRELLSRKGLAPTEGPRQQNDEASSLP
jgi:hypothetical protein